MVFSSMAKIVVTAVGVIGFLFCMLGGVLFAYFPSILHNKIVDNLILKPDSPSFQNWRQPPIFAYQNFYFFNVTNPERVNSRYTRPTLKEVGPYTFKVVQKKDGIKWNKEKGQLDFKLKKAYIFERDMSVGDMSETIYTLNIPYVGIAKYLFEKIPEDVAPYVFADLNANFRNMSVELVEPHTVAEMLFEGYYVTLLDFMAEYADSFGMTLPSILPNNTFGIYYRKNNTEASYYSIGTGEKGPEDIKWTHSYNNMTKLPYWGGDKCNMLNGSDGTQFLPGLTKHNSIYVFSSELCRSLRLDYTQDVEVKGIPALRYEVKPDVLLSAARNPENACYCKKGGFCKDGVLDVSSCRRGAPIALSLPHFLNAEASVTNKLVGLKPEAHKHVTYINVEPSTGVVMSASRRIQMNFHLRPMPGILHVANITDMFFPIFWLSESAELDEATAELFRQKVLLPVKIGQATLLAAIILGAFGLISAVFITFRYAKKRKVVVEPIDNAKFMPLEVNAKSATILSENDEKKIVN